MTEKAGGTLEDPLKEALRLVALADERLARIAREIPDAVPKESLTHAPA